MKHVDEKENELKRALPLKMYILCTQTQPHFPIDKDRFFNNDFECVGDAEIRCI